MDGPVPAETLAAADTADAVRIADRVWWVGSLLPDDPFQCHTYLIEQGDQSVLIYPGSALTWTGTLRKIEEVVPFDAVRYFVCHHPDPDIVGALPLIDTLVTREDAAIVTHWRDEALIRHLDPRLPYRRIEDHGWQLPLEDRTLHFVFTPYLHFPGAFCTYDPATGVLFSSDLFGGFTSEPALVARDATYLDAMRPFHQHYMPSREVLRHGLDRLTEYPIRMIAPQHGSLIPEHLVAPMVEGLRDLECGLYLMVEHDSDVRRLITRNRLVREATDLVLAHPTFAPIATGLADLTRELLPLLRLDVMALDRNGSMLRLSQVDDYRGGRDSGSAPWQTLLGRPMPVWREHYPNGRPYDADRGVLIVPLVPPHCGGVRAAVELILAAPTEVSGGLAELLLALAAPVEVAVERELMQHMAEQQRAELYERSIRDPLTGLHNRWYMDDAVARMSAVDDRTGQPTLAVAVLDIDHFKSVNDTYGHPGGDEVLGTVARTPARGAREGDLVVRLGGEEFAVFLLDRDPATAVVAVERLRAAVAGLDLSHVAPDLRITVSAGLAVRILHERPAAWLARADTALYEAKTGGRNQARVAP